MDKSKWLTKPNAGAYVGRSAMMYCHPRGFSYSFPCFPRFLGKHARLGMSRAAPGCCRLLPATPVCPGTSGRPWRGSQGGGSPPDMTSPMNSRGKGHKEEGHKEEGQRGEGHKEESLKEEGRNELEHARRSGGSRLPALFSPWGKRRQRCRRLRLLPWLLPPAAAAPLAEFRHR